MHIPQPARLNGGVSAFAREIVAKYKEVATLCASENDGPYDRVKGDSVVLGQGDAKVTLHKTSGSERYTVDHGHDPEGRRVFEAFSLTSEQVLQYSRSEEILGLTTMDTRWSLEADGCLTTRHGSRVGTLFTDLEDFGQQNLLK